jgi:low affinity Fe/Cu permease
MGGSIAALGPQKLQEVFPAWVAHGQGTTAPEGAGPELVGHCWRERFESSTEPCVGELAIHVPRERGHTALTPLTGQRLELERRFEPDAVRRERLRPRLRLWLDDRRDRLDDRLRERLDERLEERLRERLDERLRERLDEPRERPERLDDDPLPLPVDFDRERERPPDERDARLGTLPPSRRASESPIAIACLRLFTFLPDPPERSVPRFRSCMAFSTFWEALRPYLRAKGHLQVSSVQVLDRTTRVAPWLQRQFAERRRTRRLSGARQGDERPLSAGTSVRGSRVRVTRDIEEKEIRVRKRSRKSSAIARFLETFSVRVTEWAGSSLAFAIAVLVVLAWALTGPVFHYSNTWQLVINTGTTIVTFLMVFLIQRAQNKDSRAAQLKLNEIVAALEGASNRLINVEDLSEQEILVLRRHYAEIAKICEHRSNLLESHSIEEAHQRDERKAKQRKTAKTA